MTRHVRLLLGGEAWPPRRSPHTGPPPRWTAVNTISRRPQQPQQPQQPQAQNEPRPTAIPRPSPAQGNPPERLPNLTCPVTRSRTTAPPSAKRVAIPEQIEPRKVAPRAATAASSQLPPLLFPGLPRRPANLPAFANPACQIVEQPGGGLHLVPAADSTASRDFILFVHSGRTLPHQLPPLRRKSAFADSSPSDSKRPKLADC